VTESDPGRQRELPAGVFLWAERTPRIAEHAVIRSPSKRSAQFGKPSLIALAVADSQETWLDSEKKRCFFQDLLINAGSQTKLACLSDYYIWVDSRIIPFFPYIIDIVAITHYF